MVSHNSELLHLAGNPLPRLLSGRNRAIYKIDPEEIREDMSHLGIVTGRRTHRSTRTPLAYTPSTYHAQWDIESWCEPHKSLLCAPGLIFYSPRGILQLMTLCGRTVLELPGGIMWWIDTRHKQYAVFLTVNRLVMIQFALRERHY